MRKMFRLFFICAIVGVQIGHSFTSPCTCTDHKFSVNAVNVSTESYFKDNSSIPETTALESSSTESIVGNSSSNTSVTDGPVITNQVFVESTADENENQSISSTPSTNLSYAEVEFTPIDSINDASMQLISGREVGSINLAANSSEESELDLIHSANSDNNSANSTPYGSSIYATMDSSTRTNLVVLVTDQVFGPIAGENFSLDSRYSTEDSKTISNSIFSHDIVEEIEATTTEDNLISSNFVTTNSASSQKVVAVSSTTDISILDTDRVVEENESSVPTNHEDIILDHSEVNQDPERALNYSATPTVDNVSSTSPAKEFNADYINLPDIGNSSMNVTTDINPSTLPGNKPSSWLVDPVLLRERDNLSLSNSSANESVENTYHPLSSTTDEVPALYSVDSFQSPTTDQLFSTIYIDAQISESTSSKNENGPIFSITDSSHQESENWSSYWTMTFSPSITNETLEKYTDEIYSTKSTRPTEETFSPREDQTDSNYSTIVYSDARPSRNDSIDSFTSDGTSASSIFSTLDYSVLGSDGISDHKETNTTSDFSSTRQSFEKRIDYYTSSTSDGVSGSNSFMTTISDEDSTVNYTNSTANEAQNSSIPPYQTFDEVLQYETDSANLSLSTTSQSFEVVSISSIQSTVPSTYLMENGLLGQNEVDIDSIHSTADHNIEENQTTLSNSTSDRVISTSVSPITNDRVQSSKFDSIISSSETQVDSDTTFFTTKDIVLNSSNILASTETQTISTIVDYDHTKAVDSKDGRNNYSSLARELLRTQAICSKLILSEIMCIASATSCIREFESDISSNKTLQAIAIASSNLWVKLSTMKRVNEIYLNASMLPVELFQNHNITKKREIIERLPSDTVSHLVLSKIDVSLRADYALRKLYLKEMDKIDVQKLPVLERIEEDLPENSRLPSFVVNQYFLANADGLLLSSVKNRILPDGNETEFFERHLMARAIFHLSIWEDTKVQSIYNEAVNCSVQICTFLKDVHKVASVQDVYNLQEVLFSALDEGFAKNTKLNAELMEVMNEFRNSEREHQPKSDVRL